MEFIWAGDREQKNLRLTFELSGIENCDTLIVNAVDFYRIFVDGVFVEYGPDRTAAGYSRQKTVKLNGAKNLQIEVASYNVVCYACDRQLPFFGAELYSNGKCVYKTTDFTAKKYGYVVNDVQRFSPQRGFVEYYNFFNNEVEVLTPYFVDAPTIIGAVGTTYNYPKYLFTEVSSGKFLGFDSDTNPEFNSRDSSYFTISENGFNVTRDFVEKTKNGEYSEINYVLDVEKTGFLQLYIQAEEDVEIFCAFNEILVDGKWIFRRLRCNEVFSLKMPKGNRLVQSFEPYSMRHLKIVYKGNLTITPVLIGLENGDVNFVTVEGNERFVKVFNAAKNSFSQAVTDIFMDCPSRERAGWLCDAYFMGKAEALFTGSNKVERAYLENFLIGEYNELPKGMLPKSFPSEHEGTPYIPNWAMWFVIELYSYYTRTSDNELVKKAKQKVYDLLAFFKDYTNEYGLLENLPSWVFIEWSVCNWEEYVCGVNFPTNMLYVKMLEVIAELYSDDALNKTAQELRKTILDLSFNGEYFVDNAIRKNGKLEKCLNHTSETCQYYALFFGFKPSDDFANNMRLNFGPLRPQNYLEHIGRSNMFVGNYLRFIWLCEEGYYDTVINETFEYFAKMVEQTGTLWEHDSPKESCNHGFPSVAAAFLLRCVVGYDTVKQGKPIFIEGVKNKDLDVTVKFKTN